MDVAHAVNQNELAGENSNGINDVGAFRCCKKVHLPQKMRMKEFATVNFHHDHATQVQMSQRI